MCVDEKKMLFLWGMIIFKSTPCNVHGFYERMGNRWCGCGYCVDVVVNLYVFLIWWGSGLELDFLSGERGKSDVRRTRPIFAINTRFVGFLRKPVRTVSGLWVLGT